MSKTKGVVKLVVNTDTDPTPQEPSLVENETSGIFVHSTNSSVASRLWFSQGTSLSSSFSKLEFDTDIGLKIHTENPVNVVHDASIRFGTRGSERWKIEGLNGSSGDLLPATDNSLKIGRTGFNLNSVFSRQLISDDTLALAASGATKWNIDSSGHFVPTATTQNIGSSGSYLSFVYANQLLAGTGQALYLGSNAGTYKWYIANSSNAALVPNTAGAFDLGTSSNRVGTLYSTNINNSGSLTTDTIDSSSGIITDVIQTRTTASSLSIKTGTSYPTRVTIDSSGNVGIGTTSPSVLLDLASSDPQIKLSRPSIPSGTVDARLATGNDVGIFGTYSNHSIILTTNGTEKLRILQNGRVGINNIAPTRQLDINGDFRTSSSGAGDLSITHTNVSGNLISNVLSASGVALSLGANGSEAIRVDTSNKVGIGVSSPVARLHVADNFQIGSSPTATNNWHFAAETGDGKLHFYNGDYGAGTLRATMTSAGNLGIGTSTPSGILHLNKSSGAADIYLGVAGSATGILYSSSSDTTIGSISASPLVFLTGNTEKMQISASGNVGIGASSPQTKLHVAGALSSTASPATAKGTIQIDEHSITSLTQAGGLEFKSSFANSGYGSRIVGFDDGTMIFARRSNSSTWSESFRVDPIGRVGIGTTTPSFPLSVLANTSNGVTFESRGRSSDNVSVILFNQNDATTQIGRIESAPTSLKIQKEGNNPIVFTTNSAERLRITGSGNVGIGNTDPGYLLDCRSVSRIATNLIDAGSFEIGAFGTGDRNAFIDFRSSDSHSDWSARIIRNLGADGALTIANQGTGAISLSNGSGPVSAVGTSTGLISLSGNASLFAPSSAAVVLTAGARNITVTQGNGIEITSSSGNAGGYIKTDEYGGTGEGLVLYANRGSGSITLRTNSTGETDQLTMYNNGWIEFGNFEATNRWYNDLLPAFNLTYDLGRNPTGTANDLFWNNIYYGTLTQSSDSRLKDEIQDCSLGLSFINDLRPVSYKFIVAENIATKNEAGDFITTPRSGKRPHYGLIAQEVKTAIDKAGVDFAGWKLKDKDDPDSGQMLSYLEFIAPLIKAVQELSDQVSELKAELTELKNK